MKFLVWGTGNFARQGYELLLNMNVHNDIEIVGFVDNDQQKWGRVFNGKMIISPGQINSLEWDAISIWVGEERNNIKWQIIDELKISGNKIIDIFEYLKKMINEKYVDSNDLEIQEFLCGMNQKRWLDVYNFEAQNPNNSLEEVYYDENAKLHYIFFENKKMYLKKTYKNFVIKQGKRYVGSFWREQDLNSPHLYEEGEVVVEEGDVLVDAGVCEGNFSLHNIEKLKKVYLIECDKEWIEALHYTFLPYQDKVIFCDKFLSDSDSDENTTCLDSLLDEPVNFIKMDIEGEEVNALIGAKRVFAESNSLKCAICSYHRHNDEEKIKSILEEYGMNTYTSKGYMLFLYDMNGDLELRRGIVRGIKRFKNN